MNERIKELAEQCGFKSNPDVYDRNQSFDIPKFAELIVRECIDQCADIPGSNDEWDKGVRWAANQIKQHFGVEE